MIPTLPLEPRNRLAETILAALHDPRARRALDALAQAPDDRAPDGWLSPEDERHATLLIARARRAARAIGDSAPSPPVTSLASALAQAKTLFDAGLYFEVHELLEPYWRDAGGESREALQGLIQIAVGYQHAANGNLAGARALLTEGSERITRAGLPGFDLTGFAPDVAASMVRLPDLGDEDVPRFPRATATR